jgi:hypothetical protein
MLDSLHYNHTRWVGVGERMGPGATPSSPRRIVTMPAGMPSTIPISDRSDQKLFPSERADYGSSSSASGPGGGGGVWWLVDARWMAATTDRHTSTTLLSGMA